MFSCTVLPPAPEFELLFIQNKMSQRLKSHKSTMPIFQRRIILANISLSLGWYFWLTRVNTINFFPWSGFQVTKNGQAMPRNICHWVVGRWTMTAPSLSNDPYLTVRIWKDHLISKSPTFICYIIFFIMEKQTLPFLLTLILDRPHIVFNINFSLFNLIMITIKFYFFHYYILFSDFIA